MNKQRALKKLQELVDNGFAFGIAYEKVCAVRADNLLYRLSPFVKFKVTEALSGGILSQNFGYKTLRTAGWKFYGVLPLKGTFFSDIEVKEGSYGENSKLVTFEEIESLLEILEKEDILTTQRPEIVDSVKAIAQNTTGASTEVILDLFQVPVILSPSQAKVLADTIYTNLEQFTSPLSVGDTVSDNNQSLVVYGIDGDKIWCKNEESGEYFTHSREKLIKMENK